MPQRWARWRARSRSIAELETALKEAEGDDRTTVIVIDTDPLISTDAGGHWWDVAVPEVSAAAEVNAARKDYEEALQAAAGWELSDLPLESTVVGHGKISVGRIVQGR